MSSILLTNKHYNAFSTRRTEWKNDWKIKVFTNNKDKGKLVKPFSKQKITALRSCAIAIAGIESWSIRAIGCDCLRRSVWDPLGLLIHEKGQQFDPEKKLAFTYLHPLQLKRLKIIILSWLYRFKWNLLQPLYNPSHRLLSMTWI